MIRNYANWTLERHFFGFKSIRLYKVLYTAKCFKSFQSMEREKNPYFFRLQKIDDFEVKNNCMDFDQFLHRFFSVLTKGNR